MDPMAVLTSVGHNGIMKKKEDICLMGVSSARNRLIYFRVSEEELSRFRSLATLKGSRSLSDFAREALEKLSGPTVDNAATVPALLEHIHELRDKMDSINQRLEQLSKQLVTETSAESTHEEGLQA
jgi:Arc/MetJ-type ribon-helix-helix transcriptional regulator